MPSGVLLCCGCVRFPVELDSIVGFLLPLATDQFSAHKLCFLLSRISWLAETESAPGLAGCVQRGDEEGTVVLTKDRQLFKQGDTDCTPTFSHVVRSKKRLQATELLTKALFTFYPYI